MKNWLTVLFLLPLMVGAQSPATPVVEAAPPKVYILPIREDIMPPLVYVVRRGVKEAMEAKADLLVLDMDTNGGRVDTTEEIVQILDQFKGKTLTYVNRKAFSAGAFIAVATQKIYMSPQSYIGAAAPILMMPGGGVEKTPDTLEVKMTSGVSVMVRAYAEKNGYNPDVVEAMIDKNKELKINGEVLKEKGKILALTSQEAAKHYGNPPKPLLSSGTFEDLDTLLTEIGYGQAVQVRIQPSGVEKLASWINMISPLLLLIGIAGIYIEFKTPGFGIPGIVGVIAFAIYFLGGYVAGLTGLEWAALFVLGLALLALEFFVFPGTTVAGLAGALLMLISIIMAMVDVYPGMPTLPTLPQLELPLRTLVIALTGAFVVIWVMSRWLPKTNWYSTLVSQSVSGVESIVAQEQQQHIRLGQVGVAVSVLRPGGKAQFEDEILNVITQGEMLPKGQRVRIIGHSASEAIVEATE